MIKFYGEYTGGHCKNILNFTMCSKYFKTLKKENKNVKHNLPWEPTTPLMMKAYILTKWYMNVQSNSISSKKKKKNNNRGNPAVHQEVSMMSKRWYSHRVDYRSD